MGFRSDYWSLYASGLRDVSLVHGLLLIRHLLDVPEVVESDLADFFGDLEDVYTREIFCRFALATEGGGTAHIHVHALAHAGTGWGPRRIAGATRWPSPGGWNPVAYT